MNSTWKTKYLTNRLNKMNHILKKITTHDVIENEDLNDIKVPIFDFPILIFQVIGKSKYDEEMKYFDEFPIN